MTTTPSINDQILALTNQGLSLEAAAKQVLYGDKGETSTDSAASTDDTRLSLEDEIALSMFHSGEAPLDELADEDGTLTLPAVMIDPPTHRRVRELARKRHQTIHQAVRGLVRKGLAHTIQEGD